MTKLRLCGLAQGLRKTGLSIGEIAQRINASKSSVSLWCKNIVLSRRQIERINFRHKEQSVRALLVYQERARAGRIQRTLEKNKQGEDDVGKLSRRDEFILGLGLYWAEGYKKADEFGFVNSDPKIIVRFVAWLERCYKIPKTELILRVTINESERTREGQILQYWAQLTGTSSQQFTKTSFVHSKTKKEYENQSQYFGILRVKVRNSSDLKRRVMGSISTL